MRSHLAQNICSRESRQEWVLEKILDGGIIFHPVVRVNRHQASGNVAKLEIEAVKELVSIDLVLSHLVFLDGFDGFIQLTHDPVHLPTNIVFGFLPSLFHRLLRRLAMASRFSLGSQSTA